ncbi:hypothetical protein GF314_04570 [bacterium]|jgi:hypothetical protein|nr:hypothetical protein [bacterium]
MNRAPAPRHTRVLIALSVVLLIGGVIGYLQADTEPSIDRVYLPNGGGAVVFDHAAHTDLGPDCIACHHPLAGEIVADCVDCHEDGYTADLMEHEDLVAIEAHTCDACHEIAPDDEAQNCRECHDGADVQQVYHQQCNGCHLASDRDRFATDDGQARCETCHLQ